MIRRLKKLTAALLTAVMVFGAAACADTSTAVTINGTDIKAGEYIFSQFSAISTAINLFKEANPDLDTTVIGFNYYNYEIEGVPFRDYVVDEALKLTAKREAYSKLFDELGLSFTEEERIANKTAVNSVWSVEDEYLGYYGIDFKTWGLYYESLGISKASYQRVYENEAKAEKVFLAYYDEGGSKEVSPEELKNVYENDYARFRMIEIKLTDESDEAITDTDELKKLEDLANFYVNDLKNNELFSAVYAKYEQYLAGLTDETAVANAEEEVAKEDEENTDEAEDAEVVENDYDNSVKKGETSPTEEVVEHIFSMELNKPELFKTEDVYYVLVRLDINERDDWFTNARANLLYDLKGEEMIAAIDELAASLPMVKNEAALNRYEPNKLI